MTNSSPQVLSKVPAIPSKYSRRGVNYPQRQFALSQHVCSDNLPIRVLVVLRKMFTVHTVQIIIAHTTVTHTF